MVYFSQRNGFKPLKKQLQKDFFDDDLKNSLWNIQKLFIWDNHKSFEGAVKGFSCLLWKEYFKKPLDEMPRDFFPVFQGDSTYLQIRGYFFKSEFFEILDLFEFIFKNAFEEWVEKLKPEVNRILEEENALYRVVGDEFIDISSEEGMAEIEQALNNPEKTIAIHLTRALELLSDRKQPDYRNSIKESISAVETACRLITQQPSAELSSCLKALSGVLSIHSALKEGFVKLYGYSSDKGGVRHGFKGDDEPTSYSEARFMLITCSAFVNFLWTALSEQGVGIPNSTP